MASGTNYREVREALGLKPASRNRSGRLFYRGTGLNGRAVSVSEDEFRGEGGAAETYFEVRRLMRSDPDAAVARAETLRRISPSYFAGIVRQAVDKKFRGGERDAALRQATSSRSALRYLPEGDEYFADVVRRYVESGLGDRTTIGNAMTVADTFHSLLTEDLLQRTTREFYEAMKRRGAPEEAFEYAWGYLPEDEFVELGRDATLYHGRRKGDWRKAKEVAKESGHYGDGTEFFNKWEWRGLVETEAFDRAVHERMPEGKREDVQRLAEDLKLPQVRLDQLAALMHETDFLAER